MTDIRFTRLHETFVSEVTGFDISEAIEPHIPEILARELMERKVLLIRNQELTPAQYAEFGRKWADHTRIDSFSEMHVPGFDDLNMVGNTGTLFRDVEYRNGACFWHTDCAAEPDANAITMLYCVYAPESGGETRFADMEAAYLSIGDEARSRIEHLNAWHCYSGTREILGGRESWEHSLTPVSVETAAGLPAPVSRPLVRRHSITARKSIYAPAGSAFAIDGLDPEPAWALMHDIKLHSIQEQYCYQHSYRPGDVVMWDNSSTMHYAKPVEAATGDHDRRLLYRICPLGLPLVLT